MRLIIALFFGGDGDIDGDLADTGGDGAFSFFSLLSILAFFMGAGWMGLTARVDWEMSSIASATAATGFGFALMVMASGMMAMARKLSRTIEYDLSTAVGKTAKVYMTVPPKGEGRGKIQVSVSGRLKIIDAISSGPKLSEFSSARVVEVRDDGTFIVEPVD